MSVLCGTIKEKSEIELPRRKVSYFSLLTDFPLITEAGVSIQTKTKERKGMYREFIDEFVLSPSMREYLKTVGIIELVYIVLQSVVKPGITGFFKIDLHIKCYIYLS